MSAVYKSQNVVLSQYVRNAMLSALFARPAGPLVAYGKAHLSHDPAFNPQPNTALSALTGQEANFSGYTPQVPTPVVPVNIGTTTQGLIFTSVFEASTGAPFVGDTITGYWFDDQTNLTVGERFANNLTIGIAAPNDYVQVDVIVPLNSPQIAA
jgi:hypothetical protein